MFVNLKSALIFCHKTLVKKGHFHFAHGVLQYLRGNEYYCCAAVQAITLLSNDLIKKEFV